MKHSITPPPGLVYEWAKDRALLMDSTPLPEYIAARAAQYGADQELEVCCKWVQDYAECGTLLRLARRPGPQGLKSQALKALDLLKQRTTDPNIIEPLLLAVEQLND